MAIIRKIRRTGRSFRDISGGIEQIVTANVSRLYPDLWSMDILFERISSGLRDLLDGKNFSSPGKSIRTRVRPYRLSPEAGDAVIDAAMLVRIVHHDSHVTEGALFLQGALKDPDKNTFSDLKKDRIRKVFSVSPHSWVMMFDYDIISGMAYPAMAEYVIGDHPQGWSNWIAGSNGVLVPAGLAMELGVKTTGLYKASVPLSHQIAYRFLMGLDLDYHKIAGDVARGIRTDKGLARQLILVSVFAGGDEGDSEYDFGINREIYLPV